jgi:hypothetical protein
MRSDTLGSQPEVSRGGGISKYRGALSPRLDPVRVHKGATGQRTETSASATSLLDRRMMTRFELTSV